MDQIRDDVGALGVAGETDLVTWSYLVGTSRLLTDPLAMLVQGPTASGKSFVPDRVSRLFPKEAVLRATQLTGNALFYMDPDSLLHVWILAGERSRRQDDEVADTTRALREMLSTRRLSKLVTLRAPGGGLRTVLIERDGVFAFSESTSRANVFPEDATRMIRVYTDESPVQTRRVMTRQAQEAAGDASPEHNRIINRHHALQRLLRRYAVVIPFAEALAEKVPEQRVEVRRAFPQMLNAIRAVALLHQYQRSKDSDDRLVAQRQDYEVARDLLCDPIDRLLTNTAPPAAKRFLVRFVAAGWVSDRPEQETFTVADVRRHESVSQPAVSGWLSALDEAGYVKLVEKGRGQHGDVWQITSEGLAFLNSDEGRGLLEDIKAGKSSGGKSDGKKSKTKFVLPAWDAIRS